MGLKMDSLTFFTENRDTGRSQTEQSSEVFRNSFSRWLVAIELNPGRLLFLNESI